MSLFRIENVESGHVFGFYAGSASSEALSAMAADAGGDELGDDVRAKALSDLPVYVDSAGMLVCYRSGHVARKATAGEAARSAAEPTGTGVIWADPE